MKNYEKVDVLEGPQQVREEVRTQLLTPDQAAELMREWEARKKGEGSSEKGGE
jgi:hypothetical protein